MTFNVCVFSFSLSSCFNKHVNYAFCYQSVETALDTRSGLTEHNQTSKTHQDNLQPIRTIIPSLIRSLFSPGVGPEFVSQTWIVINSLKLIFVTTFLKPQPLLFLTQWMSFRRVGVGVVGSHNVR